MAAIENHLNKYRKQLSKLNGLAKKGHIGTSHTSSRKPIVVLGGVVHVQIRSTQNEDGGYHINLKKVTSRAKNSHGVFVAGGSEVDRLVAAANENVPSQDLCVDRRKRKVTSLKGLFIHRKP